VYCSKVSSAVLMVRCWLDIRSVAVLRCRITLRLFSVALARLAVSDVKCGCAVFVRRAGRSSSRALGSMLKSTLVSCG
jgi:hypothetical protein